MYDGSIKKGGYLMKEISYGKKLTRSYIILSQIGICITIYLVFLLVFLYYKSQPGANSIMLNPLFELILALVFTPFCFILQISITQLKYMELREHDMLYFEGASLIDCIKLAWNVLRYGNDTKVYKVISYHDIDKVTLRFSQGKQSKSSSFDTYYLSIRFYTKEVSFLSFSQSMSLNEKLDNQMIHSILEFLLNHHVRVVDQYHLMEYLKRDQKVFHEYLDNIKKRK